MSWPTDRHRNPQSHARATIIMSFLYDARTILLQRQGKDCMARLTWITHPLLGPLVKCQTCQHLSLFSPATEEQGLQVFFTLDSDNMLDNTKLHFCYRTSWYLLGQWRQYVAVIRQKLRCFSSASGGYLRKCCLHRNDIWEISLCFTHCHGDERGDWITPIPHPQQGENV